MTAKNFERSNEMHELRFVAKWTLQQIADKYNISRERVRQVLGNTGSGFVTEKRKDIAKDNIQLTNSKLSKLLGISKNAIHSYRNGERHEIEGGFLKIGTEMEDFVSSKLSSLKIQHKLMSHFHSFDILLSNGLRVDVKTAMPLKSITRDTPTYSFNLHQETRGRYTDFFICVLYDTKDMFVIPAEETRITNTPVRFSFPEPNHGKKSKWHKYHDRFDLLKEQALAA